MALSKKFVSVLIILAQPSQAIPNVPQSNTSSVRLDQPCDGKQLVDCNEDGGINGPEGPNAFKVKCESNKWIKDQICPDGEICQYFPGFKTASCFPKD